VVGRCGVGKAMMGPALFSILLFLSVALGSQYAEISQSAGPQQQNESDQEAVCFLWAFGRLTKGGKEHDFAPVKRDMIMNCGDRLRMFIELTKKCFVYVIHRSTEGKIKMLFPYDLKEFDAEIETSKPYFIPRDDNLFELDEKVGLETFFLLASAQRLHSLETLIKEYYLAEGTKKTEFAEKLLSEIRDRRWKYRTFKTFAERPPEAVGGVRLPHDTQKSTQSDLASIATEISAKTFYSKSFTIDHQ
jgi:hypothetical protein